MKSSKQEERTTHELAAEGRVGVLLLIVPALLHLLPPRLELLQRIIAVKLGKQLPALNRSNASKSIRIIAAEEVGELDELVAIEAKLAVEVAHEVALDDLVVVEHVAVDASAAEEEDIGIIGHDAVDQATREELGALGFGFLRRRDEGDTEEDE